MSSSESSPNGAESPGQSTFLSGIEFLTGDDPNLGSFLLVIAIVTCVFIALFQFTLPAPVSHLLTAGVIIITVVSAGFAALLDSLGFFDGTTPEEVVAQARTTDTKRPWVPSEPVSAPLPPMLNFDDELQALSEHYDGDLPEQFDSFIAEYKRLKTNPGNRSTIASDLRADLNPIGTILEPDTPAYERYEQISDGLFRYIGDSADHLNISETTFTDSSGTEREVSAINDELGYAEVTIDNDGEPAAITVVIELYEDDTLLSSRSCPVGTISPGESHTIETDIFVPKATTRARTVIEPADA